MHAQYVVRMFDGADDEDVLPHDGNVPASRASSDTLAASFGPSRQRRGDRVFT
jgi:hypothetical protein